MPTSSCPTMHRDSSGSSSHPNPTVPSGIQPERGGPPVGVSGVDVPTASVRLRWPSIRTWPDYSPTGPTRSTLIVRHDDGHQSRCTEHRGVGAGDGDRVDASPTKTITIGAQLKAERGVTVQFELSDESLLVTLLI